MPLLGSEGVFVRNEGFNGDFLLLLLGGLRRGRGQVRLGRVSTATRAQSWPEV